MDCQTSSLGGISSMGFEIMASCEDCLDGEGEVKVESMGGGVVLGVGQGEVKGGGVDFGVINSLFGEILEEVIGETCLVMMKGRLCSQLVEIVVDCEKIYHDFSRKRGLMDYSILIDARSSISKHYLLRRDCEEIEEIDMINL
ncbi:hypothetical protein Tco_0904448 [Tanacetum coccineum]